MDPGGDVWVCLWPLGLLLYSCPWFSAPLLQPLEKEVGYEKNNDRRPLKLSGRNGAEERGSIWVPSTWNSNYASTLIFGIVGAPVQDFYSQKEYSPFSWIITKLPEKIVISSETNNSSVFKNLKQNLFFKYLLSNLMASFFWTSAPSAQPKREFTNQHHSKCRPSSGPAPLSVCQNHDVRAALR